MGDIDGVLAGKRLGRVRPASISVDDYHGMIEMLTVCTTEMDTARVPSIKANLTRRLETLEYVLAEGTQARRHEGTKGAAGRRV